MSRPTLDLAVIGAGVAGAYVAYAVSRARPAWSIALFERSGRIGGRLRSIRPDGGAGRPAGGSVQMEHDLAEMTVEAGNGGAASFRLRFAGGAAVRAARVVLAMPSPALLALAQGAPVLARPDIARLIASVEPFPASKLYLWYDRPWWRGAGFAGLPTTTERPSRKVFYFDPESEGSGPAVLLAEYTDGMDMAPWRALSGGTAGPVASPAIIEAARRELRLLHGRKDIPEPVGSAYADWGADPRECGWHFWRRGARSREVLPAIVRPDPALDLFLCGEAYSTSQALVEGALESAVAAVRALTGGPPTASP